MLTLVGAPAQKARETIAQRKARESEERRAAFFTPGNIVSGYGNTLDRVIAYHPPHGDERWSVDVQEVKKIDGKWVDVGAWVRNHSTLPSGRDRVVERAPARGAEAAPEHNPDEDTLELPTLPGNLDDTEVREDAASYGQVRSLSDQGREVAERGGGSPGRGKHVQPAAGVPQQLDIFAPLANRAPARQAAQLLAKTQAVKFGHSALLTSIARVRVRDSGRDRSGRCRPGGDRRRAERRTRLCGF